MLVFERVPVGFNENGEVSPSRGTGAHRAKVPGGWLVHWGEGMAFVPDPDHRWDGSSPP